VDNWGKQNEINYIWTKIEYMKDAITFTDILDKAIFDENNGRKL